MGFHKFSSFHLLVQVSLQHQNCFGWLRWDGSERIRSNLILENIFIPNSTFSAHSALRKVKTIPVSICRRHMR